MRKFKKIKCLKKIISVTLICAMLAGCAQRTAEEEGITAGTEAEATAAETTVTTSENITTVPETTAAKTTVVTTEAATEAITTTAEVTEAATSAPAWAETSVNKTMYVNRDMVYSRVEAIIGSQAVNRYSTNDKVQVVAETDTGYCKIEDGSFIHKDYLGDNKVVIAPVVTTTTPAANTPAPEVVPVNSNIETLLNGAKLNPMKTNEPDVDAMVDSLLGQITNSGMSTYQKVKAIYDYMIRTYSYGDFDSSYSDIKYTSCLDYFVSIQAYTLMSGGSGVCNHYASLFTVLTRRIGLESYAVSGCVATKSGGVTGHVWSIIKLNSSYYLFDPQVEQCNLVNGTIAYNYFGRSEQSMNSTYTYAYSSSSGSLIGQCAWFQELPVLDNARDCAIALFHNFELANDGECPYDDVVLYV